MYILVYTYVHMHTFIYSFLDANKIRLLHFFLKYSEFWWLCVVLFRWCWSTYYEYLNRPKIIQLSQTINILKWSDGQTDVKSNIIGSVTALWPGLSIGWLVGWLFGPSVCLSRCLKNLWKCTFAGIDKIVLLYWWNRMQVLTKLYT